MITMPVLSNLRLCLIFSPYCATSLPVQSKPFYRPQVKQLLVEHCNGGFGRQWWPSLPPIAFSILDALPSQADNAGATINAVRLDGVSIAVSSLTMSTE